MWSSERELYQHFLLTKKLQDRLQVYWFVYNHDGQGNSWVSIDDCLGGIGELEYYYAYYNNNIMAKL